MAADDGNRGFGDGKILRQSHDDCLIGQPVVGWRRDAYTEIAGANFLNSILARAGFDSCAEFATHGLI